MTEYTYNNGNQLTGMSTKSGSNNVETYSAGYYVDGNKKSEQDGNGTYNYRYNGLNQLTVDDHWDRYITYTYDAYGNRSGQIIGSANGDEFYTYTYNANNQLMTETVDDDSTTHYSYDENGSLIFKTSEHFYGYSQTPELKLGVLGESTPAEGKLEHYRYDGFGQRIGAVVDDKTATYTYNPEGLRVSKTVNGETTTHILDGSNVVADVKNEAVTKYNRGRELISIEQNGNKGYYTFNGHGDVTRIVDNAGTVKNKHGFEAFGEAVNTYSTSTFDNPFGYAGEYTDAETEQIYLRARYYDPGTGRFTSEDPARDGTNWYAYAGNNPVMFTDPSGFEATSGYDTVFNVDKLIGLKEQYANASTQAEKDHIAAKAVQVKEKILNSTLMQYKLFNYKAHQILGDIGGLYNNTMDSTRVLYDLAKYTAAAHYQVTDNESDYTANEFYSMQIQEALSKISFLGGVEAFTELASGYETGASYWESGYVDYRHITYLQKNSVDETIIVQREIGTGRKVAYGKINIGQSGITISAADYTPGAPSSKWIPW